LYERTESEDPNFDELIEEFNDLNIEEKKEIEKKEVEKKEVKKKEVVKPEVKVQTGIRTRAQKAGEKKKEAEKKKDPEKLVAKAENEVEEESINEVELPFEVISAIENMRRLVADNN